MTITAKYSGTCRSCGGAIHAGETIEWQRGEGARHVDCSTAPSARRAASRRRNRRSPADYPCAQCGYGRGTVEARDSSGIPGMICPRCAAVCCREELSFA